MKEVCIVNYTSNAAVYGIGTYIREYVYCLENSGCKINIVELGTDDKRPEFYVREDRNIRTMHFPYLLKGDIDRYNKGVCRLLRLYIEDSCNLVFHFQYWQSSSLLDNIKKYYPLSKSVFTIHYLHWSEFFRGDIFRFEKIIRNQESEKIKKEYGHIIEKYIQEKTLLGNFDRIVALSDDTLNLVQNLYGIKQNVWLIPNGLRKDFRNLSGNQKVELKEKYYIRPEEKILLFVGRIDAGKGIEQLLACFDEVVKEYPNCRLVVAGNGNINGAIMNCKKTYNKVTFTGLMDKKTLYQWYQIADIALFPSFHEECSFAGIEMMMHGMPVIASDGFGVRSMFHEGINAKIAKIENWKRYSKFQKNLKKSIVDMLNSDLSESKLMSDLREGAKKTYQSKYRIECMQKGYMELLNSLEK